MNDIHLLLLAAGGSSRMGRPKPLLPWGNSNLLEYQVNRFYHLGHQLSVVLGSEAERILSESYLPNVQVIINSNWELGMGHSIVAGVTGALDRHSDLKGILILLVDQPLIETAHIAKLIQAFDREKENIAVSVASDGHWSVPVLFSQKYFADLMALSGDKGAMEIVRRHAENVRLILCQSSLDDMDHPLKYLELHALYKRMNP